MKQRFRHRLTGDIHDKLLVRLHIVGQDLGEALMYQLRSVGVNRVISVSTAGGNIIVEYE
jgi:hypothetical protein